MTTTSAVPILGRPFDDYEGPSYSDLMKAHPELKTSGIDHEGGYYSLYQGNAYFGVRVSGGWHQGKPVNADKCAVTWTAEQEAKARAICDALPDSVKARRDLLPFGAYLLSTDG